jgi:hypothetical protein
MLNLESCARPSERPAAIAHLPFGRYRYRQNTHVAATPIAVALASDVTSRACARMFGQKAHKERLRSPAHRP